MKEDITKIINTIKILGIDMIDNTKSGNPGIVLDMAPVMYTLFARVLNVYPKNPTFFKLFNMMNYIHNLIYIWRRKNRNVLSYWLCIVNLLNLGDRVDDTD